MTCPLEDTYHPICKVCAMFCHNGHDVKQMSDELFVKDYCNCGEGVYEMVKDHKL